MDSGNVFYNDSIYKVIYKYDSGYWELKERDSRQIILVHSSEVKEAPLK